MKFTSIQILCAVLTSSVSAFVSPSSVAKRAAIVPTTADKYQVSSTDAGLNCRFSTFSFLKAAEQDTIEEVVATNEDTIDDIIHDLLDVSQFVYGFANLRRIVKANEGQIRKKKRVGWFNRREKYTVAFDTPALILTQDGAQEQSDDKLFKYVVTPDAIKLFIEKNRKWFDEPEGGGDWTFDETLSEKEEPFLMEEAVAKAAEDNMKIVDYDDEFSTKNGGLVYGVVINLTRKWVSVCFRGTVGSTDLFTDRDFRLDYDSFFSGEDEIFVPGGKPATHTGFTKYLVDEKMGDQDGRKVIDRILSCVNEEFKSNPDIAGKDFNFYVSGHSLGGGLANLFSFKAAQLKAKGDKSVEFLPETITALTFASPVAGNDDYNKEFQYLEKKGNLRHIRVSNENDLVPTNNIIPPFSAALRGDTRKYTQNGVNLFLRSEEELEVGYRATKSCRSQFSLSPLAPHMITEYRERVNLEINKEKYQQTVEEAYKVADDFTN